MYCVIYLPYWFTAINRFRRKCNLQLDFLIHHNYWNDIQVISDYHKLQPRLFQNVNTFLLTSNWIPLLWMYIKWAYRWTITEWKQNFSKNLAHPLYILIIMTFKVLQLRKKFHKHLNCSPTCDSISGHAHRAQKDKHSWLLRYLGVTRFCTY